MQLFGEVRPGRDQAGRSLTGADVADNRQLASPRLAADLDLTKLESMTRVVPLDDVVQVAHDILDGKVRGRVVVDVNT